MPNTFASTISSTEYLPSKEEYASFPAPWLEKSKAMRHTQATTTASNRREIHRRRCCGGEKSRGQLHPFPLKALSDLAIDPRSGTLHLLPNAETVRLKVMTISILYMVFQAIHSKLLWLWLSSTGRVGVLEESHFYRAQIHTELLHFLDHRLFEAITPY